MASEAWWHIDIRRQICNHAIRATTTSHLTPTNTANSQTGQTKTSCLPLPNPLNTPHNRLSARFTATERRCKNAETKAPMLGGCSGKRKANFGRCRTISPVASTWITTQATTDSFDSGSKKLAGSPSAQTAMSHQQTRLTRLSSKRNDW